MRIGNILQEKPFSRQSSLLIRAILYTSEKELERGVWNFFWDKAFLFILKPKQKMKFRLTLPLGRRISLFLPMPNWQKKVIDNCVKIAEKEGVVQRQSYRRVSKQLLRDAYFGHHPRRQKKAKMARKKLRTIGKRVLWELERKLPKDVLKGYEDVFKIYLKDSPKNVPRKIKFTVFTSHKLRVLRKENRERIMSLGQN